MYPTHRSKRRRGLSVTLAGETWSKSFLVMDLERLSGVEKEDMTRNSSSSSNAAKRWRRRGY